MAGFVAMVGGGAREFPDHFMWCLWWWILVGIAIRGRRGNDGLLA